LPLHLKNLGVSDAAIPNYWAVGVIAEIVLLRYAKSLFGHLSSRFVMVLCLAAAVLQYGATALVESAFWLYPIMLLHGMTFGIAYYTCVLWLGENVEPQLRTRAQALFQTVGFGVGGLLSSVAAGYLFEVGGGALMFGTSAIVNCVTIFACLWLLRPEKDDSQDVSS
jgi:PPP family 3-phenylpropionic acid transporter